MTSKRRQDDIESDSEDDGEESGSSSPSPSQKRARKDENSEEAHQRAQREEQQWEEKFEEYIRAKLNEKIGKKGGIAEIGIIQQIDLVNFLCHKNLTVKFGPQINFVIGHNGSGKSAVLTGIAVALGGKATSTGRGSGLKSFVKEGENAAEVTIRLKNEGSEAYKPDVYGKSIIITRNFNISGSSGYKIKALVVDGKKNQEKLISTKREELNAICDHMSIQVDNPLNVLTQDMSRQFISTSSPAEKYQFFLKGTQLQQLSEEYNVILENINKTDMVITQKAQALPDLKIAHQEAASRFKLAGEARKQKDLLDEVSRELAWAHVRDKENVSHSMLLAKTCPPLRLRFFASLQELMNFEKKSAEEQRMMEKTQIKLTEQEDQAKKIRGNKRKAEEEIKLLTDKIREEEQKLEDDLSGKRAELEKQILQVRERITENESSASRIDQQIQEAEQQVTEKEAALASLERAQRDDIHAHGEATKNVKAYQERLAGKFNAFGSNVPKILNAIANRQWRGDKPIGPIGTYVELINRKWVDVVKIAIGNHMSSWIVTDTDDFYPLKKILEETGNRQASIIVSKKDLFDYNQGEPPAEFTTILRILDFKDEFVKRVMINTAHIESTCVAETRKQADDSLLRTGLFFRTLTLDGFSVVRFREGGGSTTTLPRPGHPALFTGSDADVSERIQKEKDELLRLQSSIETRTAMIQRLKAEIDQCRRIANNGKVSLPRATTAIQRDGLTLKKLQEAASVAAPASISVLENALAEQEQEVSRSREDFARNETAQLDLKVQLKPIVQRLQAVKEEENELQLLSKSIEDEIAELAGERVEAQHLKGEYEKKLAEAKKKTAKIEEVCARVREEFVTWSERATEMYGDKFENPRNSDVVKAQREKLRNALKSHEKKVGMSVEELEAEVIRTKAIYRQAQEEFTELQQLNMNLNTSLHRRMNMWADWRRHIAMRCKIQFSPLISLSTTALTGGSTLIFQVQTDDQISGGKGKAKDPKSLSGGEKSFATICLLLALWEAIGCPIRCLDEFDVFMDAVNRKISMKVRKPPYLIDTAKSAEGRQFVFITPLDISTVGQGPEIRIHRMNDPERGQVQCVNFHSCQDDAPYSLNSFL
ncbi:hypothetical protein BS47DRAFT_1306174 [Hydnum rufescens UP504]|uniref:RecF/RecN/SMC N-terminal domain-containing protein n=1 Tax=Hydnum rufescens UP504 TaxID=1448309 RepID=A0A9P6AHR4_9AGAM|nr:hypothetical protein BS47DRAFT_1306174 [Hydnum rufescens UP504]